MIDMTRWPLNADFFFSKEHISMTSEIVQGHSDVGLREELKNIWNEKTLVRETYMCSYLRILLFSCS